MTIFSGFSHRKIICFPSQTVILEKSPANKAEKKIIRYYLQSLLLDEIWTEISKEVIVCSFCQRRSKLNDICSVQTHECIILWRHNLVCQTHNQGPGYIFFSLISALWSHTVISAKTSEALRGENYMYFWISKITFCMNPQKLFQPLDFQKGEFSKCL